MQEESEIAQSYPKLTELKHLLSKYATPWYIQLSQLLKRSVRNNIRTPRTSYVGLIQTVILAVIIGSIFFQIPNTQTGFRSKAGVIFFTIINQSLGQNALLYSCTFTSPLPK